MSTKQRANMLLTLAVVTDPDRTQMRAEPEPLSLSVCLRLWRQPPCAPAFLALTLMQRMIRSKAASFIKI